jgi:hypothetical protein
MGARIVPTRPGALLRAEGAAVFALALVLSAL